MWPDAARTAANAARVCPQNIPLHLLNRKFIKDIDEIYGDYQAGESVRRAPSR